MTTKVIVLYVEVPERHRVIEANVDDETFKKLETLNGKMINSDDIDPDLAEWLCAWVERQGVICDSNNGPGLVLPEISGKLINTGFIL